MASSTILSNKTDRRTWAVRHLQYFECQPNSTRYKLLWKCKYKLFIISSNFLISTIITMSWSVPVCLLYVCLLITQSYWTDITEILHKICSTASRWQLFVSHYHFEVLKVVSFKSSKSEKRYLHTSDQRSD